MLENQENVMHRDSSLLFRISMTVATRCKTYFLLLLTAGIILVVYVRGPGSKFFIDFHAVVRHSRVIRSVLPNQLVEVWINNVSAEPLDTLFSEFWEWRTSISPEFSTSISMHTYNDKLTSYKYEELTKRWEAAKGFSQRLSSIERHILAEDKKVSYDILKDILNTFIDGYKWKDYEPLNPINNLEGWFLGTDFVFSSTPFNTEGDFNNYIRRIELIPQQLDEMINLSRKAIANGHTSHNASVSGVPDEIDKMVANDTVAFDLYKPFNMSAGKIFEGNSDVLTFMDNRLKKAITGFVTKIKELKQFLITEYMPKTRLGFGINSLPNGTDNYKACLYFHTSTKYTAEEIHDIGLKEVKRISNLIRQKMDKLGISTNTTISQMYNDLSSNSRFLIDTPEKAIAGFKEIIFNRIDPLVPNYFKNLPNIPLVIQRYDGGGEYKSGTADGSKPGIFFVNVNNPKNNPTYNMVSFSLHEAIPGHHTAESYALLAKDIPKFRRHFEWLSYSAPYFFPFYNALSEGWALYAEFLGEEMGAYRDDYEFLGRYRDEIFRACRLVLDTGIHHYNWSRQQAIDYLRKYTGYEFDYAAKEIDRYATWPGQAIGYKIGEVKIKELRLRAQQKLGKKFDLADFHYTVLQSGLMPLSMLEDIIDRWITAQLEHHETASFCTNVINSASHTYVSLVTYIVVILLLQIHNI